MWAVQAQLITSEMNVGLDGSLNEWTGTRTYPTFYLDERVQGIVSPAHCIQLAEMILDPMNELNLSIIVEKIPDA